MLGYTSRMRVSHHDGGEYMRFALDLADRAGHAILQFFRSNVVVDNKRNTGNFDPVTAADKEAERIIRAALEHRYPEHGIFGEEFGHRPGNGLTWVIDPIDGTRAFMTGMLHWGVLLALFDGEQPVLGVMHQPFTGESFFGDNAAAYYRRAGREQRLRCRACTDLGDAVLATTNPKYFVGEEQDALQRLESRVKLSRYGGDCYMYAMLAMGYIDLATDGTLQAYDIQALIPIIRGAGGVVTTIDGGDASMGGTVVAAGSRGLHERALACMAGS